MNWINRKAYQVRSFFIYTVIPAVKKVVIWSLIISAAGGISYAYAMSKIEPEKIVEYVHDEEKESSIAVLDRIAKCESGGKQIDEKGRLVKHVNKDGSVDFGKFQINDKHWELKAIELGYNIYTLEGNEKMATWIYENRGTEDWKWSRDCWLK